MHPAPVGHGVLGESARRRRGPASDLPRFAAVMQCTTRDQDGERLRAEADHVVSRHHQSPRSMASCAASGRIVAGGHYFTGFVFARLFMYFFVLLVHGLIYRRTTSTLGKDEVEATVERIAIAMRKNTTIPRVNYTLTKSLSAVYRKGMQRTAVITNAIQH
jgi:hypothetical protein